MSTTDTTPAPSPRLSMLPSAHLLAGRRPRRAFLRAAASLAGDIAAFIVSLALALAIFAVVVVAVGALP